ncbi:MAG: hypothetical protein EP329_11845 [Deltaproteobacteria bacterium]|nr:MAG: hypothetical protein EP329_11845 [Deltaproteobacteria bacterium]
MSSSLFRVLGFSLLIAVGSAGASAVAAPADKAAPAKPSLEGTYKNGGGATLTVRSVVADKGFKFDLSVTSEDDCNGVSYSGEVKFTKPNEATNDEGDSFKVDGAKLHFEPAMDMIGMDCARVFDVDFSKK